MINDEIQHVAVIGAGNMGHGIAEVALLTGYSVSLYDIKKEFVENGRSRIEWSLQKFVEKNRISNEDYIMFMDNLSLTIDLQKAVKQADLVIEAAPEKLELKKKIFADLDYFAPEHAIFASNTSNMSITGLGAVTNRPDKVIGMHFFHPPVMMKLIEIISGEKTSDVTLKEVHKFTDLSGKISIISKDSPGFICNRIAAPGGLLVQLILHNKEYSPENLDAAALNLGMYMGPCELQDYLGLDVLYHSFLYLSEHLSKDYIPTLTLEKLVKENKLGKKTGEGIFKWPDTGRPNIDISNPADFDVMDIMRVQINEAAKVLEEGIGSAKDIDIGMKLGFNNPWGPFELVKNTDLVELTVILDNLAEKYGKELFRAHKWIRDSSLLNHIE